MVVTAGTAVALQWAYGFWFPAIECLLVSAARFATTFVKYGYACVRSRQSIGWILEDLENEPTQKTAQFE